MGNRLEGKVAIVTGGTRGIGKGIATAFVAEGAKVVFTGRDLTAGAALEEELGKNARFVPVDVAKEIEVAKMVKVTTDYYGGLNCLVSNAGGGLSAGAVTDMNTDKFWENFHVNVGGVVYGMKHAATEMAKRGGGSIINISSIAASRVEFGNFAYCGAKAAVSQLSKFAAMNLAPHDIRVNVISPGPVVTAIFGRSSVGAEAAENRMENIATVFEDLTPLHMAGRPDDIAHAAVYLAGDDSKYVTGQELVIDGGITNSRPAEEVAALWGRIAHAAASPASSSKPA